MSSAPYGRVRKIASDVMVMMTTFYTMVKIPSINMFRAEESQN
jgi:hypothetical protein